MILQRRKYYFLLLILITTTILIFTQKTENGIFSPFKGGINNDDLLKKYENHIKEQRQSLTKAEVQNLSALGRILYLDNEVPIIKTTKQYTILLWKYGHTIETRHLKNSLNKANPFAYCSVQNCKISYKDSDISTADIVVFHLHRMKGLDDVPKITRNPNQIWAFSTDESPYHTFLHKNNKLSDYDGIFNWSMTYRLDSDIPVPYGRTVTSNNIHLSLKELWYDKRRDVLVTIMGSNCGGSNNRWKYIKELEKHIAVDIYGGCGTLKCQGHFYTDCPQLSNYLFYLAFENSNCEEYITEKLWWNAYEKNAIPIVMGASKESYAKLAPPGSYINIENYATPADLARHLLYLNNTGEFTQYYEWRRKYQILNEHGYFGTNSYHYCRVCEALNYNSHTNKVYKNLTEFWNVKRDCRPAWNVM